MPELIKSSNELQSIYGSIAEYTLGAEDLTTKERLFAAERSRLARTLGYSVQEFEINMRKAIRTGASSRDE